MGGEELRTTFHVDSVVVKKGLLGEQREGRKKRF